MKHSGNFKQHSPANYWVISPQRWTKQPLKSMVIFIFLKFGMVKVFETLQTFSNVKMNIFHMKIFNEITLLLFVIYSFIKFKVLVSLPKSFHGPLGLENVLQLANWPYWLCYWSQFNWAKQADNTASVQWGLFTFSEGTHGFDVTVPKNYLKLTLADFILESKLILEP